MRGRAGCRRRRADPACRSNPRNPVAQPFRLRRPASRPAARSLRRSDEPPHRPDRAASRCLRSVTRLRRHDRAGELRDESPRRTAPRTPRRGRTARARRKRTGPRLHRTRRVGPPRRPRMVRPSRLRDRVTKATRRTSNGPRYCAVTAPIRTRSRSRIRRSRRKRRRGRTKPNRSTRRRSSRSRSTIPSRARTPRARAPAAARLRRRPRRRPPVAHRARDANGIRSGGSWCSCSSSSSPRSPG